jgi:hypothetical protein
MSSDSPLHEHPPGYRTAIRILWIGAVAVPAFWFLEMLTGAALTGYACYPGLTPRDVAFDGWGWVSWARYVFEGLAAAGAGFGLLVSYRIWDDARRHAVQDPRRELGEGRTQFIAIWGMLFSGGFLLAILFDVVITIMMPLCTKYG